MPTNELLAEIQFLRERLEKAEGLLAEGKDNISILLVDNFTKPIRHISAKWMEGVEGFLAKAKKEGV